MHEVHISQLTKTLRDNKNLNWRYSSDLDEGAKPLLLLDQNRHKASSESRFLRIVQNLTTGYSDFNTSV